MLQFLHLSIFPQSIIVIKNKEKELTTLTGIIDKKNAERASEVKKLTGIIDEKSQQIIELHRWSSALQEELEAIKSRLANRIYDRIDRLFKQ